MRLSISHDIAALRDDYVDRVNALLEEGREDLAREVAEVYLADLTDGVAFGAETAGLGATASPTSPE